MFKKFVYSAILLFHINSYPINSPGAGILIYINTPISLGQKQSQETWPVCARFKNFKDRRSSKSMMTYYLSKPPDLKNTQMV